LVGTNYRLPNMSVIEETGRVTSEERLRGRESRDANNESSEVSDDSLFADGICAIKGGRLYL